MNEPRKPRAAAEEILAAFLEQHPEPTPEEVEGLCEEHSEIAEELRRFIAAKKNAAGDGDGSPVRPR